MCSGINQSSVHGNAHTAGIYIYFQIFHCQHKNVISLVKRESRLMFYSVPVPSHFKS